MVFVEYQSAKGGEGKREGCLGVICKREPADLIIWYGEYGEYGVYFDLGYVYLGILGYPRVYSHTPFSQGNDTYKDNFGTSY